MLLILWANNTTCERHCLFCRMMASVLFCSMIIMVEVPAFVQHAFIITGMGLPL